MKMILKRRTPETHDSVNYWFEPEDAISYISGQYLRWTLAHEDPDDRGIKRFFTICSSPTEPLIHLTTKFHPTKGSSFKRALRELAVGDALDATGPGGDFILPSSAGEPVVLVAGGIGVTPYRSMLKHAYDTGSKRAFTLLYACRSRDDICFGDELDLWKQKLKLNLIYILETPPTDSNMQSGRIDGSRILELASVNEKLVYLSGPQPMAEGLKDELVQLGLPETQIKTDYFPGYLDY